jgi:hypothetical protein
MMSGDRLQANNEGSRSTEPFTVVNNVINNDIQVKLGMELVL